MIIMGLVYISFPLYVMSTKPFSGCWAAFFCMWHVIFFGGTRRPPKEIIRISYPENLRNQFLSNPRISFLRHYDLSRSLWVAVSRFLVRGESSCLKTSINVNHLELGGISASVFNRTHTCGLSFHFTLLYPYSGCLHQGVIHWLQLGMS